MIGDVVQEDMEKSSMGFVAVRRSPVSYTSADRSTTAGGKS